MKENIPSRDLKEQAELFEALASLKSPEEVRDFLQDLCTPTEIESLADRWAVARLVDEGIPYRRIQEITGVSTATITRVARTLSYGQGYKKALERMRRRRQ